MKCTNYNYTKYFIFYNYYLFFSKYHKIFKIKYFNRNNTFAFCINSIWSVENLINLNVNHLKKDFSFRIFGSEYFLNNISWHKDFISGFEYPRNRFDRMNIEQWFDKGIDVKLPWEMSRFYFSIKLAQDYKGSKDKIYYNQLKKTISNWIKENPFLYGVNWVCPMEAAIRSINWIVSLNLFGAIFKNDKDFNQIITKSLIEHAEYISLFPEVYENGHTTNHATSDYVGLLFLALTLNNHPKSKKWLNQSIKGLEQCMIYQVYEDGADFEASIPYHRLVLELFGFAAVLCRSNQIVLSKEFYKKLFLMFEYTAAYMDHNGNAPQVGDNDSGRILIFHESEEFNHSYLLDLGEHIFDYQFKSLTEKRNTEFVKYIPFIEKISIKEIDVMPRQTDKTISFKNLGAYILKNKNFSLFISCFSIGSKRTGGHNHYDFGSISLSYKGIPFIVDAGTYNYTRSKERRDEFRLPSTHNIPVSEIEYNLNRNNPYWQLSSIWLEESVTMFENTIEVIEKEIHSNITIKRKITLKDDSIFITDSAEGSFLSSFHFHPDINALEINKPVVKNTFSSFIINTNNRFDMELYNYSDAYDHYVPSQRLIIFGNHEINFELKFL